MRFPLMAQSKSKHGKFSINQNQSRTKFFDKHSTLPSSQGQHGRSRYRLHYWFHSKHQDADHTYSFSDYSDYWLFFSKNKDYVQGIEVNTSDLLMYIWLLPCTLSEHSSLARSLIICGIKTSFSTCLSLEFSARETETKIKGRCYFFKRQKSVYRNNTTLFIEQILRYKICHKPTAENTMEELHVKAGKSQDLKWLISRHKHYPEHFLLCSMCKMNQK